MGFQPVSGFPKGNILEIASQPLNQLELQSTLRGSSSRAFRHLTFATFRGVKLLQAESLRSGSFVPFTIHDP